MRRTLGSVVVTVGGVLDLAGSVRLGSVVADLIDGQGNLAVEVDLTQVVRLDPAALGVFAAAAKLARHHGGALSVTGPPDGAFLDGATAGVSGVDAHLVEFYETDAMLARSVGGHLEPALREDDSAIVVATTGHRQLFEVALRRAGVDVDAARGAGRYLDVDAGEALSRFMVDGAVDPARFRVAIGGLVAAAARGGRTVHIYGEMVSLLWAEGNVSGAIALEDLWNDLGRYQHFSLLCAYPTTAFDAVETTGLLRTLCEAHLPSPATSGNC